MTQTTSIILYFLSIFSTLGLLIWGAVTDANRREIPNLVSLLVAVTWLFDSTSWNQSDILYRLISLGLIIVVMVVLWFVTHTMSGGGDIKLFLALALNMGIVGEMVTIAICGVLAIAYALITKKKKTDTVPVCTFLAPAYALFQILVVVISLCGIIG